MHKHLSYLDRVSETCISANKKSMSQPSGWDNKKRKNMRRYLPRGKAYKVVADAEWKAMGKRVEETILLATEAANAIIKEIEEDNKWNN